MTTLKFEMTIQYNGVEIKDEVLKAIQMGWYEQCRQMIGTNPNEKLVTTRVT